MPATYEPIATTTLTGNATSITFSSITSSYTDLRLIIFAKTDADIGLFVRFNNDSGSNYSNTSLEGNGVSALSGRGTNSSQIPLTYVYSGQQSFGALDIFNYAGSTNKTALTERASDNNGSGEAFRAVSLWRDTTAINRIDIIRFSGNMTSGTTATLYGILKA